MDVKAILAAIRGQRQSIGAVVAEITKLEAERDRLRRLSPNRDEVVAWAMRSIDSQVTAFEEHLSGWYLNPDNVGAVPGSWFEGDRGVSWLGVPLRCPGVGATEMRREPLRAGEPTGPETLSMAALVYFLAPTLRESVPKLIDKHFPIAKGALPAAERAQRLADVEAKLSKARAQLDDMQSALAEAASAVDEART